MKSTDPTQDLQDGIDLADRVEPEPMRAVQPPYPRLCEAGPCRHYHRLEIQADVESSRAFRTAAELPPGTPGATRLPDGSTLYAPPRRFHVQVNHYCYPKSGIEITLGDTPVVKCNRWDPIIGGKTETEERRHWFEISPQGIAHAAEVNEWERRQREESEAAAKADEIIERATNPSTEDEIIRVLTKMAEREAVDLPPGTEILACIEGKTGDAGWHWLARDDARRGQNYLYAESYGRRAETMSLGIKFALTLDAALQQAPEAIREELASKIHKETP